MKSRAAITIVSKNYFAFAQTLAESYLQQHPGHDFIIVLVDRADGMVPASLPCGAQVVEIASFQVPDLERMIYRYSIMELNTAVKPFVLADLFERFGYETLLYIDPDIWVFSPMQEVYDALSRKSVVLTPHMRRPVHDDRSPSDTAILQSGTYNLGFVGLRRGDTATRLLDWWMGKLHMDCRVDIPNGLFVDQKWIDLVPGFFPDHEILYHPGYNAAYWNLHERPITRHGEGWLADGQPLVFFHFSGYLPFAPDTLSKHQDRHVLADLPGLKSLTDAYADELIRRGYEESCRWPYAFATLSNGVRLPLDLVAPATQWAARRGLDFPCPVTEPNAFCAFLMTRGWLPHRPQAVLLFDVLIERRGDVAAAFPGCVDDHDHEGFRGWLMSSGVQEYALEDLLPFEVGHPTAGLVEQLFEAAARAEPAAEAASGRRWWSEPEALEELIDAACQGIDTPDDWEPARAVRAALPELSRIVHLYFLRADLQAAYADLSTPEAGRGFVQWLREHRYEVDLDLPSIDLFEQLCAQAPEWLARASFLYKHRAGGRHAEAGIYSVEARRMDAGTTLPAASIKSWLAREQAIPAIDHHGQHFGTDGASLQDFTRLSVQGLDAKVNFEFVKRMRLQAEERERDGPPVNLAGYLTAPTGMGESARSMQACLAGAGREVRPVTLPHPQTLQPFLPASPVLFGWPASNADLSIAVANADSATFLESFLPASFWGRRSVGYWVWETEELPARFRKAESLFHEVWTPSAYSASAISRTVGLPVRVLPHTVDLQAAASATADRPRFGLPPDALLFGFAFDPLSVLERKNVAGLVDAFQAAFRDDDRCRLVLKVNARGRQSYELQRALARAVPGRVLLVEDVLDREDTFCFLKSLDAYVSLHRSEGFGLTCAEAMACGVPVVATGYSGNLEFMSAEDSLLVPAAVVQTDRPWGPYPAGTRWAQPDGEAAAVAMRRLLDAELRRHLGSAGAASVARKLSAQAIGSRLQALLQAPANNSAHAA